MAHFLNEIGLGCSLFGIEEPTFDEIALALRGGGRKMGSSGVTTFVRGKSRLRGRLYRNGGAA